MKSANLVNQQIRVLRRGIGIPRSSLSPRQGVACPRRGQEGGLDKPRVRRGVAKLCRDEGLRCSVVILCRGVVLFIDMCFCHVFLFRYSKDLPIRLMRTL